MATYGYPVIPETITVHLGAPGENARNVEVSFSDYIKNVASSEIYPTWPENAIRANIYAQITFALNRIYTEHYRSRGYDFDITNSTKYDQAFVEGRDIFENISLIVDDIFNNYVYKQGSIAPYFTQYCNGTTVTCPGLSQWGTVDLANQGYTPYEILQHYYGDDISIMYDTPVQNVPASYPGYPLKLGTASNYVKVFQTALNRIRRNYPAIPKIDHVTGVFDQQTEKAVKEFQKIFNLTVDGIIGKATWYKIIQIYNGVTNVAELNAEGLSAQVVEPVFLTDLSSGAMGNEVKVIQYYLSVVGYFNNSIPVLALDGYFGPKTEDAVRQFQTIYGLPVTGKVDVETWQKLSSIYLDTVNSLPASFYGKQAHLYPGYVLTLGTENDDVAYLQTYLNKIGQTYPSIGQVPVTGVYDSATDAAVREFRQIFGLPQATGVGPSTWLHIATEYNRLIG